MITGTRHNATSIVQLPIVETPISDLFSYFHYELLLLNKKTLYKTASRLSTYGLSYTHQHFPTCSAEEYKMPEKNTMLHSCVSEGFYISFNSYFALVL